MKYRKKPVVIEAFQFTKKRAENCYNECYIDVPDWFIVALKKIFRYEEGAVLIDKVETSPTDNTKTYIGTIKTLEEDHTASVNDWIVKGVKGELYPVKPDIFKMTYEKT